MAAIPGKRPFNRFPKVYQGSFGLFQTSDSYATQFLQTSLGVEHLGDLSTASEVMDLENSPFEELIQRDIDPARVRDIANKYLAQGAGRPIFFPPLIVCVALMENEDGTRIKAQYDSVDHSIGAENGQDYLVSTYDEDGFRIRLPIADADHSDRSILWTAGGKQKTYHFYAYASELAVNPRRAKLVVLDGQHRLEALRLLTMTAEGREIVASIQLPICLVWPPAADVGGNENITGDFRELFITINSEPQRVSGHFLILLDDKKHSSMAVRELANAWKQESTGWRRLHLLEWNTRDDESTDRRTRRFSITTISIVSKVLHKYLFEAQGLASKVLDLDAVADKLEAADPEFSYPDMRDARRNQAVTEIIRSQLQTTVVPALRILLRELPPYAKQEDKLGAAVQRLEQEVGGRNAAFSSLAKHLARFSYDYDGDATGAVQGAYADFRSWARTPSEHDLFYLAVFQQGLLRMWLRIAALPDISAIDAAHITQRALAAYVANLGPNKPHYLGSDVPYCQRMLWRREAVNYGTDRARLAWTDILIATLIRPDVLKAATTGLAAPAKKTLSAQLEALGLSSVRRYAERLWEETVRETRGNLGDYFGEEEAGRLREIRQRNLKQFESVIIDKSKDRFHVALRLLSNALERSEDDLYDPA